MIVFVRTKNETETLAEKLRARGYSATAINGDVAQAQRERTVNQLKSGKLDILVATDVAARGLDVERISHVVNYDIPTDTESYVHRIGRTGRAGRSGDAISFVTPRERYLLKAIEKATRQPLDPDAAADASRTSTPPAWPASTTRSPRRSARPSASSVFRDIIAHYVREHDVPEVDVAAALAVVAQGDEPLLLDPDARAGPPGRSTTRPRDRVTTGDRGDRVASRGDRAGPRAARAARRPDGDVPDRGRQAPQGRAAPDRRRARQRGRPRPRRLRAHRHPPRLLARRAARRPAARHAGTSCGRTRISGKLIELSESQERGSRPAPAKPYRKGPRD